MRKIYSAIARFVKVRFINRRDIKILQESGMFDYAWYHKKYPDVSAQHIDPVQHYVRYGAAERRDPHPLFQTQWYLTRYPDIVNTGVNPFVHYIKYGEGEGRDPNPIFDTNWYFTQNPTIAQTGENSLTHYIDAHNGGDPNPLFDSKWYVTHHPEIVQNGENPLSYYLEHGFRPGEQTYDSDILLKNVRIAVVIHLYYSDLWEELVLWLKNIPIPFDLYVTTPTDNAAPLKKLVLASFPLATIIEVKNIGRDIAPFLSILPKLVDKHYLAICKLHTKKGQTLPTIWRDLMLRNLLGSKDLVTAVLRCFRDNPKLLLVGPKELYVSGPLLIMNNRPKLDQLISHLYPGEQIPVDWGFFAGTMFWINGNIISKLIDIHCPDISFECEDGSNDGTMAHAIERLFGLFATLEQGDIGLIETHGIGSWGTKIWLKHAPGDPAQNDVSIILNARLLELQKSFTFIKSPALRKWTTPSHQSLGVNFIGPVEFVNGVSISARGYVACLMETQLPINVIPWRRGFERLQRIHTADYPSTKLQSINLIHLNLDLLASAQLLDRSPLRELVKPIRYNIAIIYWELLSLPPEWAEVIHRFDEVWCASSFMAQAISAISKNQVRVVRPMLNLPVAPCAKTRRDFGIPEGRFLFFYAADAGSILGRKNPQALIDAYLQEFSAGEGACCLIKIHYSDPNHPEIKALLAETKHRPDIIFMDGVLSASDMHCLFQLIDCYVSPHRSEGLGLTILEAMAAGKPVIATPYGGSTDFVTPQSAWPLDYQLTEIEDGNAPYPAKFIWANPTLSSMRKGMRRIFSDHEFARQLGEMGKSYSEKLFSPGVTVPQLKNELKRIWDTGHIR